MDALTLERRLVAAIAVITILTGVCQIAVPELLLPLLARVSTALGAHLLATVGMFMVLFGGLVLQAQARREALPVALFWAALQKFGAALFVAWGVDKGVFIPLALAVAGFDLLSGLLMLDLLRRGG